MNWFPIHLLVRETNDTWKPITTDQKRQFPGNVFLWTAGGHQEKEVISPRAFIQISSFHKTKLSLFLPLSAQPRMQSWRYGEDHNDENLSEFCRIPLFYERELYCNYAYSSINHSPLHTTTYIYVVVNFRCQLTTGYSD